jgi:hypothetical protein
MNVKHLAVLFTLMSLVAGGVLGLAQDTTTGAVQCDSELVLNLYVAQNFFGHDQVRQLLQASGAGTTPMIDPNVVNKGQFTPLFDMGGAATDDLAVTDQQINNIASLMAMDEASLQSTLSSLAPAADPSMTTPLNPPAISGEAPECSQLRSELNKFFTAVAVDSLTGAAGATGEMGGTGMEAATPTPAA